MAHRAESGIGASMDTYNGLPLENVRNIRAFPKANGQTGYENVISPPILPVGETGDFTTGRGSMGSGSRVRERVYWTQPVRR